MASSTSDRRPYRLVVNKEWENIELGGDEGEGGGDSEVGDKEQGTKKFTARKRIKVVTKGEQSTLKRFGKGKQILVDEESEEEYEGSEVGSEESEEEDSDCGDERREDCSDSELSEMIKVREEIRKENEALEQQQSQFIRDTLRQFGSKYNDYNSHSTGGSLDELYYEDSEDEDEEVAYAEPPTHSKKQRVNKIFNKKTAGKDIRWKEGLVFESKKELKDAVREVSIATGRPMRYSVDDKLRVQLGNGFGYTFIFDQQKGLEKAVKELLPHVENRNCCRHIYNNLRKKHPTEAVKNCFWEAATTTYPEAFKCAMKALKKHSKGAAERLREFDPKIWSKAYYGTHSKTESTENNISECFNSWILRSRYMPLIDMLTEIHDMIMERMHQKIAEMKNVECILLPKTLGAYWYTLYSCHICYSKNEEALRNNEADRLVMQPSDNNVNAAGGKHVRSIFMPTPGLNRIVGFGGTPPASHPRMQLGTSKASKAKKGRPFTEKVSQQNAECIRRSSFIRLDTRAFSVLGKDVVEEVIKEVQWYFVPSILPRKLEHIVGKDMEKPQFWSGTRRYTEDIVIRIVDDVLDESIIETILAIED
ncbi:hypothetical protein POM88_052639 [Heracleum sosnowskyi]|uniref:DUF4378 domain-containing protein n=1 Tax=Heracleum sosnowskyi TaxID=360622 RepID=A0AAD8LXJ7_9APIA|nr:hypothetical protein POM88_052639 [Heracleum sosnowskyi]